MTVPVSSRRAGPLACDGVETDFDFAFKVFTTADVAVILTDSDGVESTLVLNSGYTVTLSSDQESNPGGTITTIGGSSPYAAGNTITMIGALTYKQGTSITNLGGFLPSVIMGALDYLAILIQQLKELTDRSLRLPASASGASTELPVPEGSTFLGWNALGTALQNYAGLASAAVSSVMEVFVGSASKAAARAELSVYSIAEVDALDGANVKEALVDAKGDLLVGTAADTVARKAIGSDGQVLLADSTQSGGMAWVGGFARKNAIIGGDFTTNPWQRGTSFTNLANGVYCADRFLTERSDDAAVDILKTADAPTAAQAGLYATHCLHADVTTADASIGASQSYRLSHRIEGLSAARFGFGQAGTRHVTLSFWHKHTKTGTYCVSLRNSAGNRSYVAEYSQAVSDTWEKATLTIPVDTSGTWLYGRGDIGLVINWALAAGSTFQSTAGSWQSAQYFASANQVNALDSASNNFKIALVQLEAGQQATEFDALSADAVLRQCQRYFEKSYAQGTNPGTATTTNQFYQHLSGFGAGTTAYATSRFAVTKMGTPTVTAYSPNTGASGNVHDYAAPTDRAALTTALGDSSLTIGAASLTAGLNWGYHWTASAEL